ncbi:MAG: hypothetical protein H7318_05335 [Oligoflexus sp.]|nr:hypothetical protein [Oligoflexus sp.]
MKKILTVAVAVASLSSLNACGVQGEDSTQKGFGDWFKKTEPSEATRPGALAMN